ncbi:MAG: hypothetical protein ACXADB_09785 [Candidatus Hermodarchaeia archaeon]|jgi:hypothetical protein
MNRRKEWTFMKRSVVTSTLVFMVLILSLGVVAVSAAPPRRTVLSVKISSPPDGLVVANGESFGVEGNVLAKKGDAGLVNTYVQYAVGEGSTNFRILGSSDTSIMHVVYGNQPQSQSLLRGESYNVFWTLAGPSGTYEIRIYSETETNPPATSESVTVRILGAGPPPGIVPISSEEQDPSIGYGVATGSFENTYYADRMYEILSEEKNRHGTKKPVDDTTELGWIFHFENLETPRTTTTFYFYGFAEFGEDDSDTAFLVQEESGTTWSTILEISHTGGNKILSASITDVSSSVLRLRIVDNDQTIGNKEISSLHIDQAFIGLDDYEPPIGGIEILTPPYRCHHFQVWENFGNDWYNDTDIPITAAAATDIKIIDLDLDGRNEIVVGETIHETLEVGIIEIFNLDYGTTPIETLYLPAESGSAVRSLAVGNFDSDPECEIAAITFGDGLFIWDKIEGAYQISFVRHESANLDEITAGNLDDDIELEIVLAVGWDPISCDVVLYDYDPIQQTWINTANFSEFTPDNWFYKLEINDFDNNGIGELYVMYYGDPFIVLSYTDGELVEFMSFPDVIVGTDVGFSFVTGDMTDDGAMDIVFYTPFLDGSTTGFRIFEYDELQDSFVNTYNISNPGMANIFGNQMAIGDVNDDSLNELVVSGGAGGIYSEGTMYIFKYDTLIFMTELDGNDSNCVVIGDYDNDS